MGDVYKHWATLKRFSAPSVCGCGEKTSIVATDDGDYDYHTGSGVIFALVRCDGGHEHCYADNGCGSPLSPLWRNTVELRKIAGVDDG